jgi:hypothetical protein
MPGWPAIAQHYARWESIGAETIVVGERVAGLVDPVVDTATEVLDEGTESRRFTLPTAK